MVKKIFLKKKISFAYTNKGKLAYVTSVTSCLTIINNVTNISNDLDPLGYRTKIMILINSVSAFRLIMSDDENGGSQNILNDRPSAFIMDTPRQHNQQQPQQLRNSQQCLMKITTTINTLTNKRKCHLLRECFRRRNTQH